jgi:hypothetical protein
MIAVFVLLIVNILAKVIAYMYTKYNIIEIKTISILITIVDVFEICIFIFLEKSILKCFIFSVSFYDIFLVGFFYYFIINIYNLKTFVTKNIFKNKISVHGNTIYDLIMRFMNFVFIFFVFLFFQQKYLEYDFLFLLIAVSYSCVINLLDMFILAKKNMDKLYSVLLLTVYSFVLFTGTYSIILTFCFYLVIEILNFLSSNKKIRSRE